MLAADPAASPRQLMAGATRADGAPDAAGRALTVFFTSRGLALPGDEARRAIWERFVRDITDEEVDLDALVAASDRFACELVFLSRVLVGDFRGL